MTLFTLAHQAPLSMEFSRQEYWSGLPFPSPGDLPNPETEPWSPSLHADSLPSESPGEAIKLSKTQFFTWFPEVKFSLSRTKKKKNAHVLKNLLFSCSFLWNGIPVFRGGEASESLLGVMLTGKRHAAPQWALARICWVSGMVFFTHLCIPCPAVFKRYDWFESGSILLTQVMLP